jgi:hypothetical protein
MGIIISTTAMKFGSVQSGSYNKHHCSKNCKKKTLLLTPKKQTDNDSQILSIGSYMRPGYSAATSLQPVVPAFFISVSCHVITCFIQSLICTTLFHCSIVALP